MGHAAFARNRRPRPRRVKRRRGSALYPGALVPGPPQLDSRGIGVRARSAERRARMQNRGKNDILEPRGAKRRGAPCALAALLAMAATGPGCGEPGRADTPDGGEGRGGSAMRMTGPAGWLEGTVRASYPALGSAFVSLVDVSLHAHDVINNTATAAVPSDFYGSFKIPVPNGKYQVCWSKPGFTSACTSI